MGVASVSSAGASVERAELAGSWCRGKLDPTGLPGVGGRR